MDEAAIERLERLVALRDSGALTEAEFQRLKADVGQTRPPAPGSPSLLPPALAASTGADRSNRWRQVAIGGAAVAVAAVAMFAFGGSGSSGTQTPDSDAVMPDVVCMNLQDAQDLIQEQGHWYSASRDATGQGRNQIIDSNWQVVAQAPAAGSPIGSTDPLLSVVKYGEEPNPCS